MAIAEKNRKRLLSVWIPWGIAILSFVLFLPTYHSVAEKRAEKFNSGISKTSEIDGKTVPIMFHYDQHVYLNTGRMMRRADYNHFVPRHRTPGYPFLLSLIYDPDHEYQYKEGESRRVSDHYFENGKQFNINISMICIVSIFVFLAVQFNPWFSLLFAWAIGWFQFIFRAPFTQPEILFTTLFLFSFVLLARQIIKPNWIRGVATGILLAATFMLKAAVLPLVALFVACFALKYLLKLFLDFRNDRESLDWKGWLNDVARGAVIPVVFVALLSPYLWTTFQKYGNPFWSVHSQHFMWLETREEKREWRHLLDIIDETGAVPEGAPSKDRYFREHSLAEFVEKGFFGANKSIERIARDYRDGYRFLTRRVWRVALVVAVAGLLIAFIPRFRERYVSPHSPLLSAAAAKYWILALYFGGFFFGYLLLYGSYQIIGAGPRLVLSMYPAVLFSLWLFIEKLSPKFKFPVNGWKIDSKPVFRGILILCLIPEILNTLQHEVMRVSGGG